MKISWWGNACSISLLFAFRMLGLFMLIPVFTVYASELSGSTPKLMGAALGCYGLTQGILQMPFGFLSDRYGRKPMILLGLVLFALGSLLGAWTHTIGGMILARMLQGMGAIGSVLIALLADVTPDQDRTKAMAIIGVTIGISFGIAMVISPLIVAHTGLSGIFYLTAVFAVAGILMVIFVLPTPQHLPKKITNPQRAIAWKSALKDYQLQRLYAGIFCQHFMLTATFFAVPLLLNYQRQQGHFTETWQFYLPLMLISFLAMIPFILLSERKNMVKTFFLAALFLTVIAQWTLAVTHANWQSLCAGLFCYFVAFNFLEANLPSLISKQADASFKGTAMGIYSSSQFLGLFAGGACSGICYTFSGATGIFIMNGAVAVAWFIYALQMKPNQYTYTLTLKYDPTNTAIKTIQQSLSDLNGVQEVVILPETASVLLRVYKEKYLNGSAETVLNKTD